MKRTLLTFSLLLMPLVSTLAQQSDSTVLHSLPAIMHSPKPDLKLAKEIARKQYQDKQAEKGIGLNVYKRWEWRAEQNVDSLNQVNWNKGWRQFYQKEFASNLRKEKDSGNEIDNQAFGLMPNPGAAPCPQNGRWTMVGIDRMAGNQGVQPTGIGRINDMCFHPTDSNTFWACAPQGGLWKTTNNGSTWRQIFGSNNGQTTIGVSCVVVSYNNPDTMYIGTGDRDAGDAPGVGVLVSFNGGTNWVTRNSGIANLTISKIIMHPRNSRILMIATNSGLYRSTDAGVTWTNVSASGYGGFVYFDLVYHPFNPNIVYATGYGYFFRSTNSGISWSLITSGLPTSNVYRAQIAVSRANRGAVYMVCSYSNVTISGINYVYSFQGLYRSLDSGITFTTRSISPNILGSSSTGAGNTGQGFYDIDIVCNDLNANEIYVGGINIWRSTDGGASWALNAHWTGTTAESVHADIHCLLFNRNSFKIYACTDGGIYYAPMNTKRYIDISNGLAPSQVYRITVAQNRENMVGAGLQDNGQFQMDWDDLLFNNGGDGMGCIIDPKDYRYAYVSSQYGNINRFIDRTGYWPVGGNGINGISETGPWITPFILQEGSQTTMFAGYQNVWRSTNVQSSPPSFTNLTSWGVSIKHLENSPAKNTLLYVLRGDNRLYRTSTATSASVSFTDLTTNLPGNTNWIEAHHKDSNVVYCVSNSGVFRSRNRGVNWTNITGSLSGVGNINCIVIDTSAANDLVYIGTNRGVYFKDSTTTVWTDFNNQFPVWADVTDLKIYYSKRGKQFNEIYAGTYGRGVWKTIVKDAGTSVPNARFWTADSVIGVDGTIKLHEVCGYTASSVRWRISPNTGFTFINNTDTASQNPEIRFTSAGVYNVTLVASNCQGSSVLTKNRLIKVFAKPANSFCSNTTNYQTSFPVISGILRPYGNVKISFSDNAHESGTYFADGQYSDYSNQEIFRVKPSTTYTIQFKGALNNTTTHHRVFIDYDNNGRFQNFKSEAIANSSGSANKTYSFTTPANLAKNQCLRMRVLTDANAIDTNACSNLTYGEGEDYSLVYDVVSPGFRTSNASICTGSNLTFTDTSSGLINLWEWNFGAGASPATAIGKGPHSVSYSSAGNKTVKLKVNGTDSVVKTNYISVSNISIPTVVLKSGANPVCQGANVTLACRSSSSFAGHTFQWVKGASNLSGKTDSVLTLSNFSSTDAANYTCVVTFSGCNASSSLNLTLAPKPTVAFNSSFTDQCKKNNRFTYSSTSSISSGTIAALNWRVGSTNYTGTSVTNHKFPDTGLFAVKLIATSDLGCKDSLTKNSRVYRNPIVAFSINDSTQCRTGNSFTLTNGSFSYYGASIAYWAFSDGGTSAMWSPVKSFGTTGSQWARLRITDAYCQDTLIKALQVYPNSTPGFTLNTAATQCFKYNNIKTTNTSSVSSGTMNYLWRLGNGQTSTSTNLNTSYNAAGSFNLKLIVTTNNGCTDSTSSTSILINPTPRVRFTVNDSDQCLNNNFFSMTNTSSISSGSISSYTWQFGDGNSASTTNATKTYASAGNYTMLLIASSNLSCRDSFAKNTVVYPKPSVSFTTTSTTPQCQKWNNLKTNNTSSISSGSLTFLWRLGNGQTSTSSNLNYRYANPGTYNYKLIATSNFGCSDSTGVSSILIHPTPVSNFSVNDTDQCFRNHTFLFTNNSNISSGSISSYAWNFGDATSSTSTNPSKTYANYGIFTVNLSSASNNNCRDTVTKNIRVYAQPVANYTINNSLQCLKGNNFNFTNTSTIAEGNFNNNWEYNNGNFSTSTNGSQKYLNWGTFRVKLTITSNFGCIDSIRKTITVSPHAVPKFSVNDSDQCFRGHQFNFTNQSTVPYGTLSYRWLFGDGNSSAVVNPSKTYASSFAAYNVLLETTTPDLCKDTFIKPIRIYAQPIANFTINKLAQCLKGNSVVYNNTASIPQGTMAHNFNFGDASFTSALSSTKRYIADGNYTLILISTSNFGCKDTNTQNLIIYPQAKLNFTVNDSDQCISGNNYMFTNNSTISSGSLNYNWNFGDGNSSSLISSSHNYSLFGVYTVKLFSNSNNNCKDTLNKSVRVYAKPTPAFELNRLTDCEKYNSFTATGTGSIAEGAFTTLWKYGDGSTGITQNTIKKYATYGNFIIKQILTSNFGCKDSIEKIIEVFPKVNVGFNISKDTACEKELINLSNTTNVANGTLSHLWNFGDGNTSVSESPSSSYTNFGNYTVVLISTSNKACKDTVQKRINVQSLPSTAFVIGPNEGCANQTNFVFTNLSTNADGRLLQYSWNFGDGSTSSLQNPNHKYSNAGTFNVELKSMTPKCTTNLILPRAVLPEVKAIFAVSKINKETRELLALDTTVAGYNYLWTVSEGKTYNTHKAVHNFKTNDSFNAKLIVNNGKGCADTNTENIIILSPNYFSQDNKLNFFVYPNPTNSGKFVYKFELKEERPVKINIFTIAGAAIYNKDWGILKPGVYYEEIDLAQFANSAATYPFQIVSKEIKLTTKIIWTKN